MAMKWLGCLNAGFRWRVSWLFAPLPIALGLWLGFSLGARPPARPPAIVLKATLITPRVEVGGVMLLHIAAREGQPEMVCGGTVKREFWRKTKYQGRDIYVRWRPDIVPAPIFVPEMKLSEYIVPIPLEDHMPPGEYMFYGETVNICGPRPEDTIVVKSFIPSILVVARGTLGNGPGILD